MCKLRQTLVLHLVRNLRAISHSSLVLVSGEVIEPDDSNSDDNRCPHNPHYNASDHGSVLLRNGLPGLPESFHARPRGAEL